ncbi:hypothetical protein Tco_1154504 [Tanacetum coccineum]
MVRCACGLEAVIWTSWTNRNPSRRFYGCPTLSPTCVNFLRMYDPLMCQRLVQIIPGLLRSHNELEEIIAMVEEKRHKLLKFLIIGWTQREAQQANELSNLTKQRQLLASVNNRRAIIEELERLSGNFVACKTTEHLKRIQKAVFVEVIDLKKELRLQREVQLAIEINNLTRQLLDIIDERRSFIGELEQRLPTNVMTNKTRQELKCHQKDDMIRAMEMRSTALQLHGNGYPRKGQKTKPKRQSRAEWKSVKKTKSNQSQSQQKSKSKSTPQRINDKEINGCDQFVWAPRQMEGLDEVFEALTKQTQETQSPEDHCL